MDLVIMAAGLGSRFGGLKQLEPIDDENNFIIDYSIYDALQAGFDHIVIIIKEEFFEDFKRTIGNRIAKFVIVDYVFQNNDNIPKDFVIPKSRSKPFGTGHAILCAKNVIRNDFAVINADDFYGKNAFKVAANFLKNNNNPDTYALIAYNAINTLSENGCVKRGLCKFQDGNLLKLIESSIEKQPNGTLLATPLTNNSHSFEISNDTLVSMNLFAFSKKFLSFLDVFFLDFLNENKNDLSNCEFFLPTAVNNLLASNKVKVKILETNCKWFGITYKHDLELIKYAIQNMKNQNMYPENLWQ